MPELEDPHRTDDRLVELLGDAGREPLPTIALDDLIMSGRRRVWRRRFVGVGTVAAVTALAVVTLPSVLASVAPTGRSSAGDAADRTVAVGSASPAKAPPKSCKVSRLPEPDSAFQTFVAAADPNGRYVVGRAYFPGEREALAFWDNGKLVDVPMPDKDAAFKDVNSRGVAVVSSDPEHGPTSASVYHDGKTTKLSGPSPRANSINDNGDVVGDISPSENVVVPVVWRGGQGEPVRLALPAGMTSGMAIDIAEDGRIAGSVSNSNTDQPYLWLADGSGKTLRQPDDVSAKVNQIRGDWVSGMGMTRKKTGTPDANNATVRWNLRTGTVEVLRPNRGINPALNSHGWIAGSIDDKLVLDTGGSKLTLPDIGGDGPVVGVPGHIAFVADDGRYLIGAVAGKVRHPNDPTFEHAVVWRCS